MRGRVGVAGAALGVLVTLMLLGQTTGGPGGGNPIRVDRIVQRWDFTGFPGSSLAGVPPGSVPFGEPDWEAVPQGGQVTTWLRCFDAGSDEGVVATAKVPGNWEQGTDFPVYVAWSPTTAVAGNVRWCLACTGLTDDGEVWQNPVAACVTAASPGVTDQLTNTYVADLPGAGTDLTGGNNCTIYRDANDAADTYASDACLAGVIATFRINSIGTDTELAKGP